MMSSMFGTEQCISKRSSAAPSKLGATHVRPKLLPGAAAPAPCPPQPAPVRRRRTFVDCVYNYIHVARRGNLAEDCIFLTLFISLYYDTACNLFHNINRPLFSLSLTFGRQGSYHTITGRLQISTRAPRQTNRVARVFFPYGAQLGRRAR